ncbi:ScbA/BarX family gamma-butyrolactone biosynthesis protein [Actinoplanes sp. NPDC049265]|uniref:ScbA/BarX family gamma-butyrolactone biosynthesis protein n=1 Tax=Actinoplanes sp. NPDC049265 TaxID=3363902 RepID=UPI00371D547D
MITFDTLVPRALVDRGDTTTVLITSFEKDGNALRAGAVWSRLGGYYSTLDHETHDPILVLETFRQAALLIAHVVDDVPLATMQIMRSVEFTVDPAGLKMTAEPTELIAELTTARSSSTQNIMQTTIGLALYRGGDRIATGTGQAIVPPNETYLKVRGRDPDSVVTSRDAIPPAVDARTAGKAQTRDVVISPAPGGAGFRLRVDPEHPNFFDNPTDHSPGMLLTEAMRQAVVAESGDPNFLPLSVSLQFFRFVELDSPAAVTVARRSDGFHTEVRQFDKLAARASWPTA